MSKIAFKLCGINEPCIVHHCCDSVYRPDFLGFVFYSPSPRNITYEQAQEFRNIIQKKITTVAVTVNPTLNDIDHIIHNLGPQYLQFHGNEPVSLLKEIKKNSNIKIIKAFSVQTKEDLLKTSQYINYVDYMLFDTKSKQYGGTGKSFDWKILNKFDSHKPWFLSGGLNISNVKTAIDITKAQFYDISSGIELQKGVKDINKINEILKFFKNYNAGEPKQ